MSKSRANFRLDNSNHAHQNDYFTFYTCADREKILEHGQKHKIAMKIDRLKYSKLFNISEQIIR